MKIQKTVRLFVFAILLLACHQNKPQQATEREQDTIPNSVAIKQDVIEKYDPIDAQTFGFMGEVKEVSIKKYLSRDNNGNLVEGDLLTQTIIKFDENGHITLDEWGNEYEYDANGEFYRGNHTYTTIKRNRDGRLKEYIDQNPNTDSESDKTYTFTFDKVGRIISVEHNGFDGYWGQKRQYDGGNLYPSANSELYYEEDGREISTTINYRYTHFDENGNWTERLGVCSETQKDAGDSVIDGNIRINDMIVIEKQVITYHDKDSY